MRDVCVRWSRLDAAQIGSIIAVAGAIPTAGRCLQRLWQEFFACVRTCLLSSVTIPGGDPLNRSVVKWILANREQHHRSFTGKTQVGSGDGVGDRGAALKKTRHPVLYAPQWHSRWFLFSGHAFVVTRADGAGASSLSLSDPAYDGVGGEDLTVSCLGWSAEPVKRLIDDCRALAERQTQFFVVIYARDRYGLSWKPKTRAPIRRLETVHLDAGVKTRLLDDVRTYLDPRTAARYRARSMPYRRGYLFHGPPGTGKSSLSVALAGEFGLDLYEVKVPSVATDADLEQMFQEIPPRCVVLLEDIDAVWVERSNKKTNSNSSNGKSDGSRHRNEGRDADSNDGAAASGSCSLSGLLNVLDGVGSQEGRIVIMTTNHPDQLDAALVRPGRVDMRVLLGNISRACAEEMFVRMFSPDLACAASSSSPSPSSLSSSSLLSSSSEDVCAPFLDGGMGEIERLAAEFASQVPDDTFTPSVLQGFFQSHLESPREAVASIAAWVEGELGGGGGGFGTPSEKEFEVVNGKRAAV
ncbi:hypothetical protein N3K66_006406 [Trichothecium roseum]|uniref:Uncharacterized protein n=1 Tax=Trichothecium roseum TaxID=47278 RepID=A0ACC0UVA9_9HYPO|nr:hypothetical protein N3K66_006406 [Trichothecium roseum]